MSEVATIGHNKPPSVVESAKDALKELSAWLTEHPVILSAEKAKEAGDWIERTRLSLQEARAARDAETSPLNAALKRIREAYNCVREKSGSNRGGALQVAYDELRRRVTAYADAVEAARMAEAARLRAEAQAKEETARQAEMFEQDAIAAVEVGECADVGTAIQDADKAFADYGKADRVAARAERAVPLHIASMMGGKALAMRTVRVLVVNDAVAAVKAMPNNDRIRLAIVQAAKEFEDHMGCLPDGVAESFERSI